MKSQFLLAVLGSLMIANAAHAEGVIECRPIGSSHRFSVQVIRTGVSAASLNLYAGEDLTTRSLIDSDTGKMQPTIVREDFIGQRYKLSFSVGGDGGVLHLPSHEIFHVECETSDVL